MPDVRQDPAYNYNNELADTGSSNVPTISPAMFKTQTPNSIDNPVQGGTLLEQATALTNRTVGKNNPWMASEQFNTPINTKLKDTERYDDSSLGFDPLNANQEYQYGENQGFIAKWRNNLLKATVNFAGFFVDTMASIPEVVNAAAHGDLSKVYNNDINNGVQEWMDSMENKLPNFESFAERDHPMSSYLNPRYWGNSFGGLVKNLAGIGGAIGASLIQDAAVASVTDGIGELPLVAGQITKAFGKLSDVIGGGEKTVQGLNDALKAGKNIQKTVYTLSDIKTATDATKYGLNLVTSSMANGAFQAQQTYRTVVDELKKDFYEKNGFEAQGADLDRINDMATKAGNTDLVTVVATSAMVHSVIMPGLLKPIGAARKYINEELAGASKVALKDNSLDVFESTVSQSKGIKGLWQKAGSFTNALGKGVLTAADLDAQMIVQRSAEDYYKRQFDDNNVNTTDNLLQSVGDASKEFLFSKEGTSSTILGLLTGVAIHGIGAFVNAKRGINTNQNAQNSTIATILNSQTLTGLMENKYNEALNGVDIQQKMNEAVKNDNVFEFENLKFQQLFDFVHSGVKSNRFDLRMDQLESLKNLSDVDFKRMFGMDASEDSRNTAASYVDKLISKATEIKKNVDKVENLFQNPYNLRDVVDKNGKVLKKGDPLNYLSFEDYKKQLGINLSEINDNRRRITGLATSISEAVPTVDVNKIVNLTSKEGIGQTIKDFKERIAEINTDKKLAEGVDAKYGAKLRKEEAFLNEKIKVFSDVSEKFDPELYVQHVQETVDYFSNGNRLEGDNRINPLDILDVYKNAADIYKLGANNASALDNYRTLVTKDGFNAYIRKVNAEREAAAAKVRFDSEGDWVSTDPNATHLITEDPTNGTEVPIPGVEKIDENGNPITTVDQQLDKERADALALAKKNAKTPEEAVKKQAEINQEYDAKKKSKKAKAQTIAKAKAAGIELSTEDTDELTDEDLGATITKTAPNKTAVVATKKAIPEPKSIYQKLNPFTFFNKIFSTNRGDGELEQTNLKQALFTMTPNEINEKAGIKVSDSTQGNTINDYSKIGETNLYRRGYDKDVELTIDGKVVGRLQPSDSLYYKEGDTYKPVTELPKAKYTEVTGNKESSYEDFMNDVKKYDAIYKTIIATGKSELTNAETSSLFDLIPNYGSRSNITAEKAATKVADITHNRAGDVFLSVPSVYNKDLKAFERTDAPTVINGKDLTPEQKKELTDFLVKHGETIKKINSRYIYLKRLPNGKLAAISIIAARASRLGEENLNGVVRVFKDFTEVKGKDDLTIKRTNANLRDAIYIADTNNPKGGKTNMFLSGDNQGNAYFNIINKERDYSKRIQFTQEDLKHVNNIEGLVDAITQ